MSKNFELLQQARKEHDLFRTAGNSAVAVRIPDCEQAPARESKAREPETPKATIQPHWPERVKEKVRSWQKELPARNATRTTGLDPTTRREEARLVQRIFPPGVSRTPQVVIFSGVESGRAASMIGARCAEILAERAEGQVCVIDANPESPSLHRYFRIDNDKGISDAIVDSGPVQDFIQHVSGTNLWVMPSGGANFGLGASGKQGLRLRMTELRTLFQYVIIHSRLQLDRTLSIPDFAADGLVLIVEANSTRRETVRQAMEELQLVGTQVLGVVLNNRKFPIPEAIYHKI